MESIRIRSAGVSCWCVGTAAVWATLLAGLFAAACQPVRPPGPGDDSRETAGDEAGPADGDEALPDAFVRLNHPPKLIGVAFEPVQWVPHCGPQTVCATAHDPDGDPVEIVFSQASGPPLESLAPLVDEEGDEKLVTSCAVLQHAGVGMALLEVIVYDRVTWPAGAELRRFEELYQELGLPVASRDSDLVPSYGVASAECPCEPQAEVCDGADNDCDGVRDDGLPDCVCVPGTYEACYTGPSATVGVGACLYGVKRCAPGGEGFGDCEADTTPVPEIHGNQVDDDCDGASDEP